MQLTEWENFPPMDRFGPYRIVSELGHGGMSTVYGAYKGTHTRLVALKVLSGELSSNEEFRNRFRREAEVISRKPHPHVVGLHDYGEIEGQLFIEMPYVEGGTLADLLNEAIRPSRAVAVIEQIASALDFTHAAGVVHRDVKPRNILVADASEDRVFLSDFGIARDAHGEPLTGTGQIIGTPEYMAPEQIMGDAADSRTDVYGLTCVLFECLTGSAPFSGPSKESKIRAHLNAPPPLVTDSKPGLTSDWNRIVARGMAKSPSERFGSAGELARASRAVVDSANFPTAADVPTVSNHGRRFRRTWGIALLVAALLGIAFTLGSISRDAPETSVVLQPPTSTSQTPSTSVVATTESTVTPSTETGDTNSTQSTPTGFQLPASYAGNWRGVVSKDPESGSSGRDGPYPVIFQISTGEAGQKLGFLTLPTNCRETTIDIILVAADDETALFNINGAGCVPFTSFRLLNPRTGSLDLEVYNTSTRAGLSRLSRS